MRGKRFYNFDGRFRRDAQKRKKNPESDFAIRRKNAEIHVGTNFAYS